MMVDIFSGVLSGSAFLGEVGHPSSDNPAANVGHFFAAIRPDIFRPLDEFKLDMDKMIRELKDSPKAAGQERIYIPGEKEFERAERYISEGVPLLVPVVNGLKEAGAQIGVEFDLPVLGEKEEEE
jgi:LDH2 family malate/lactate/ureidoglycolate dehydrogenase